MSIEDRLRDELDREGRRQVDVDGLYASTRERIATRRRGRRIKPMVAVAASAAAVLGIAGGGLWLDGQYDGGADGGTADQRQAAGAPQEGPVDETFTCPNTTTLGGGFWGHIQVSQPDLGWKGIDRYRFVRHGDTGVLWLGLADNTLAAKLYVSRQDGWVVDRIRHCTGPEGSDVAVDGRFRLGKHGRPFPKPPKYQPSDGARPGSSVQPIDDRAFYNEFGVVDRRTVFAYEQGAGVQVAATDGELDYYQYHGSTRFGAGKFAKLEYEFLYDVPGGLGQQRDRDFLFTAYYSTRPDVTLTAELKDGSTVDAKTIRGDDWNGTLYALLAPRGRVDHLTLEHGGKTKTYQPGQL